MWRLVSLASVEDDAQGQTLDVLWEIEPDARAYESDRWHGLGTREFDNPALFAAYKHSSLEFVTATDATLLQAPFRAGIRIEDYQLEPLRKALRLPRVNLLIADHVGLVHLPTSEAPSCAPAADSNSKVALARALAKSPKLRMTAKVGQVPRGLPLTGLRRRVLAEW